jgi:hypothetical protein
MALSVYVSAAPRTRLRVLLVDEARPILDATGPA